MLTWYSVITRCGGGGGGGSGVVLAVTSEEKKKKVSNNSYSSSSSTIDVLIQALLFVPTWYLGSVLGTCSGGGGSVFVIAV